MEPVHFSTLKHMAQSPQHYLHARDATFEESRAMRIGSCAHALVLGGRYHLYEGERRGNAWKKFQAEHDDGATIVTTTEYEAARAIADAVAIHALAQEVLALAPQREQTLNWSFLGRACAGRVDAMGPEALVELKTTSCADPGRFCRHAFKSAWQAQLAWYLTGLGRSMSAPAYFIAVESTAPCPVTVFQLTQPALESGLRLCEEWMRRLLDCEAAGQWPGYAEAMVPLDLPAWAEGPLDLIIDGEELSL